MSEKQIRSTPPSAEALRELSAKATPGPWKAEPKRIVVNGQQGPIMSYLYGDGSTPEGMRVSLGSERIADHEFVACLVNAFRDGLLVAPSETKGRLNPNVLPSLPGQKELTVTMVRDDGDVQADAAIEAIKSGTSTFHITNPSPLFFHHLRLRVALEPALADRIAVYYLMPTREWRAVGLTKDAELRWPRDFELQLWEKESQITAVRAGAAVVGNAAEIAADLRRKYGC